MDNPKSNVSSEVATAVLERRREPRFPASGEVRLFFADPLPLEVKGRLLDMSQSGFRAAHGFPGFQTGQSLHFRHEKGQGTARVMWNRILPEHIETGFLVL